MFRVTLGYRCLHQKGIRQEIQSNLALHRWSQLRVLRDTRDQAFHLLLPRTSCDPFI